MSSENNAQGIEKEDKEAIADKQRPPVRLAAQKAIHRIREQLEMNTRHERYQIHYDSIIKHLSFANHSILFLIGPGECHKLCNYDVTMCAIF